MNQDDLEKYSFSPKGIMGLMFQDLKNKTSAETVPNSGASPVAHLYEMAATLHVDSSRRLLDVDKRHYAIMGETEEELYPGMVGVDYLDRFATPGKTELTIRIPISEILKYAVVDEDRNLRRLIIGKHSSFAVSDVNFTLNYPIELRVLPSDGVQAVWVLTDESELETKSSTTIQYSRYTPPGYGYEVIDINIDILQCTRGSVTSETSNTGFNAKVPFNNNLYHVEVAHKSGNEFVPLETTYSALVYDPSKPTAVLKRIDNELVVWIPQIYFERGLIRSPVKIDIITTLGDTNKTILAFDSSNWSYKWSDTSTVTKPLANVAMNNVTGIQVFANTELRGGTAEKTLAELKERKLNNVKQRKQPITNNEFNTHASDLGYTTKLIEDSLGNRRYLLTNTLLEPTPPSTEDAEPYSLAAINSAIVTQSLSVSQWQSLEHVVHESGVFTVSNKQNWILNGGLQPIDDITLNGYKTTMSNWCSWLNSNKLMTSPFYYTVDNTGQYLDVGVFELDHPVITKHTFVKENVSSVYSLGTGDISLRKTDEGYVLYVATNRSENLKELDFNLLGCQLHFSPNNGSSKVGIKGVFVGDDGKEGVYKFDIKTEHLVYLDNTFNVGGFTSPSNNLTTFNLGLEHDFNVYWVINNNVERSSFDPELLLNLHPANWVGLAKEALTLRFGERVEYLLCNNRRVEAEAVYQLHETDVVATYPENVPKRDPQTKQLVGSFVANKWVQEWEHIAGDPVLINGEPEIRYKAGVDPVLVNGEPVITNANELGLVIDLFVLEGGYKDITVERTANYYKNVLAEINGTVLIDLPSLKGKLLPNTSAFYSPVNTVNQVKCSIITGETIILDTELTVDVRVYLTHSAYLDVNLRNSLASAIQSAVYEHLKGNKISTSGLIEKINSLADDIVAVGVNPFAGEYESLTLLDTTQRFVLDKEYYINDSGEVAISDKLNISWVDHTV